MNEAFEKWVNDNNDAWIDLDIEEEVPLALKSCWGAATKLANNRVCLWAKDVVGNYSTSCEEYYMTEDLGVYCKECGGKIKVTK